MSLTNEHVGPMILAKIKIYVFTRAELLFQVCYETPCRSCDYNPAYTYKFQLKTTFITLKYNHMDVYCLFVRLFAKVSFLQRGLIPSFLDGISQVS